MTICEAPTCAARWRSASGEKMSESKYSWRRYSVGFFLSATVEVQLFGRARQTWSERSA
jgi:hypothetical protein